MGIVRQLITGALKGNFCVVHNFHPYSTESTCLVSPSLSATKSALTKAMQQEPIHWRYVNVPCIRSIWYVYVPPYFRILFDSQ